MKYSLHQCVILLTCALLAAGQASAAGREPARKATASASTASGTWRQDLEAWLARLQGSFAIKVTTPPTSECRSIGAGLQECKGKIAVTYVSAASCSRVGEGPGLRCTFDELRRENSGNSAGGVGARASLYPNGLPTRMLLGIDPVARKIRVMVMDGNVGYDAAGSLSGNTVALKGRCEMAATSRGYPCSWTLSIQAPPDGQRILMTRSRADPSDVGISGRSDLREPHTFELSRVEQAPQPRN
jgi:hypothetical protein